LSIRTVQLQVVLEQEVMWGKEEGVNFNGGESKEKIL
jgi:hypothetical protein